MNVNKGAELVVAETRNVQSTEPINNMLQLLEKGVNPEDIEKLLCIQERHEANEAKKAYNVAISEFKKNPPIITRDTHVRYVKRDGTVVEYDHASLGVANNSICEALSEYGLTANWYSGQEDGKVSVKCVLSHAGGHSEETELSSEPDTSGGKNSIQAIGSAITYLQRYTIMLITGLSAVAKDDDGRSAESIMYIDQTKINNLRDQMAELEVTEASLLKYSMVDRIDQLTDFHYEQILKTFVAKRKIKNANND